MASATIPNSWCCLPGKEDGTFPVNNETPLIIDVSRLENGEMFRSWIEKYRENLNTKIAIHGAVVLRGGPITDSASLEPIACALLPDIADSHPFDDGVRKWRTRYVWEAGAKANNSPIQRIPLGFHNEDSFIPMTPKRILFCCLYPPDKGGETAIVDCRRVLQSIPRETLKKYFGIRFKSKQKIPTATLVANAKIVEPEKNLDLLAAMAGVAEVSSDRDGFLFESELAPITKQVETGRPIWFNRLKSQSTSGMFFDLLYGSTKSRGLLRIQSLSTIFWFLIKHPGLIYWIVRSFFAHNPAERPADTTPVDDWRVVRAHWDNAVLFRWRSGDILIVDNHIVAHGRMPFSGKRDIVGCMSSSALSTEFTGKFDDCYL